LSVAQKNNIARIHTVNNSVIRNPSITISVRSISSTHRKRY